MSKDNAIAVKKQRVSQMRGLLDKNAPQLVKALESRIDVEHFQRIVMTTYQRGGDRMLEADPISFLMAVVEAAQLGLKPDPNLGECYLIPRWNKAAQRVLIDFQVGYKGLLKLVRRSGAVADIQAEIVYQNDDFAVELGTSRSISHVPWYCAGADEPGEIVAAYATAVMSDGTAVFSRPLVYQDLVRRAEMSGRPGNKDWSNVWRDHFESMARKTAARDLCKWLPMPDDVAAAVTRDEYRESGVEVDPVIEVEGYAQDVVDQAPPQSLAELTEAAEEK